MLAAGMPRPVRGDGRKRGGSDDHTVLADGHPLALPSYVHKEGLGAILRQADAEVGKLSAVEAMLLAIRLEVADGQIGEEDFHQKVSEKVSESLNGRGDRRGLAWSRCGKTETKSQENQWS